MITDNLLLLAGTVSNGSYTGLSTGTATGTTWGTQVWDSEGNNLVSNPQDWGMGGGPDITLGVTLPTLPVLAASSTLQFLLGGSSTVAGTSAPTQVFAAPSPAAALATLQKQYAFKIPRAALVGYRYYVFGFAIGTANLTTAGTILAWMGEPGLWQDNISYPANYSV